MASLGLGLMGKSMGFKWMTFCQDLHVVDCYVYSLRFFPFVQSELARSSQLFINHPPFDTQRRITPGKEDTCSLF